MSKIAKALIEDLFSEETNRRNQGKCTNCGIPIDFNAFRDNLSKREFKITGECQICQDNFYGRNDRLGMKNEKY